MNAEQRDTINGTVQRLNRDIRILKYLETRTDSMWREDHLININDSALEVSVRDEWRSVEREDSGNVPAEYQILLSTGGPAFRIVGRLDRYAEPKSATLQFQDWGTPWVDVWEGKNTLKYASTFYFGW
mgnify:FL=1|jgi:hypothetical protein|tara:strand:- start:239 stop:622 length:384 start_codon:yes stop_codon:yes gene_type:complete